MGWVGWVGERVGAFSPILTMQMGSLKLLDIKHNCQ